MIPLDPFFVTKKWHVLSFLFHKAAPTNLILTVVHRSKNFVLFSFPYLFPPKTHVQFTLKHAH